MSVTVVLIAIGVCVVLMVVMRYTIFRGPIDRERFDNRWRTGQRRGLRHCPYCEGWMGLSQPRCPSCGRSVEPEE